MNPPWKAGFEIELLAPRGQSRADLASRVARLHGGSIRRFFHAQQEPSKVPGKPKFENITQGFEAIDSLGRTLARFVDDVTLQAGLDRSATPRPGWYRIVTDDGRLLRLMIRHCDPDAPLDRVLAPIAALFGTTADPQPSGMVKVSDDRGASVAIAAPLPGERERPCEIITPPLGEERDAVLGLLLDQARAADCTLPREGAAHIHFDAESLLSAAAIANLVQLFSAHGDALKRLVGTNPHCIRLGEWPDALNALVARPGFAALDWPSAQQALANVGLQKYCDFNLLNIATRNPMKQTFEVRILPASLDPEPILDAADLFGCILRWCIERPGEARPVPDDVAGLLAALQLSRHARARWVQSG